MVFTVFSPLAPVAKICSYLWIEYKKKTKKQPLLGFFYDSKLQQENHSPGNERWDQVNTGKVTESPNLGGLSEHARGGVDKGFNRYLLRSLSGNLLQLTCTRYVMEMGWKLWAVIRYNTLDLDLHFQDLFHMHWRLRHLEFPWFHSDSNGMVKL